MARYPEYWPGIKVTDEDDNWLRLGTLVKHWARLPPNAQWTEPSGEPPDPMTLDAKTLAGMTPVLPNAWPTDLAVLERQLKWALIKYEMPYGRYTKLRFVQYGDDTLSIVLPSAEMVSIGEKWMDDIARSKDPTYPINEYYRTMFNGRPARTPLQPNDLQDHNTRRVGEYTISLCG